jgi:hypothetical protein
MRIWSIAAWGLLALGAGMAVSRPAAAQNDRNTSPAEAQLDPEITTAPLAGTIEVTFTITLKSALPSGSNVACLVELSANSIQSGTAQSLSYRESGIVYVKSSGTSASCTVAIPYAWALPADSSTVLNDLEGSYQIIASSASAGVVSLERSSGGTFLVLTNTFPASGATTKYAVPVTL